MAATFPSDPDLALRPARRGWTESTGRRFRRQQLEQYAARVRVFLPLGATLVPAAGLYDYFVTHARAPLAARAAVGAVCLAVALICAAGHMALRRADARRETARVAAWLDPLLTAAASFYLLVRGASVGGGFAHLVAGTSLMAVLFIRTLVMPATWRRAAAAGVAVWLAYPVVFAACRLLLGAWPEAAPGEAAAVYGTVAMVLVVSLTVSAMASELLLSLRRRDFEATEASRYQIERRLGGGGMGEVWLARHGTLDAECAIKVCRVPAGMDPADVQRRFELEARQVSRLTHPNIVRIFDYGEMEDGSLYYAMERLRGVALADFLARYGPVAEDRLLDWADQILRALEEAHRGGIVHRDLKPANIFLAELGGEPDHIKLLDFGLVKVLRGAEGQRPTAAGTTLGTPWYVAPEQAQGAETLDHRADLYAVGAVLYELLSGRPPFEGPDPLAVLVKQVTQQPEPLGRVAPHVSPVLEAVVMRLLAKRPEDRFPDGRTVRRARAASPEWGGWTRDRATAWWRDERGRGVAVEAAEAPTLPGPVAPG